MKTLVLFYSYSGSTKAIAEALAAAESADLCEVKDVRRPGKLKAYTAGVLASIRGKAWPVKPFSADLAEYDRIILLSPVWASNPPPAVVAAFERLPQGKTVAVKMVSASGKSECMARAEAWVELKGGVLESFEDIKA